jgi:PAS domain S-box-containing protein
MADAAQRQAALQSDLVRETTNRHALEIALTDAEAAREFAAQQHASDVAEAAARLADQQRQTDTWLADAAALADALDAKLGTAAAALERAEQEAALERHTASEDASRRQTEFAARLADEVARLEAEVALREARDAQLRDMEAALERARERHASELAEAGARLAHQQQQADTKLAAQQRQADAWLADAAAVADALDAKLAITIAALEQAEQRWALERRAASEDASRREAEFAARVADEVARREAEVALREARDAQLREMEAALRGTEQRYQSGMAAAAAELLSHREQAEVQVARLTAGAASALEAAEQRAADRERFASEQAAAREAALEGQLARAVTEGRAYSRALTEADTARRLAEEHHASQMQAATAEIAAARQQENERRAELAAARDHGVSVEQRAAEERIEWDRIRGEAEQRVQLLRIEGDRLRQSLAEAAERIQQQEDAHERERLDFNHARTALEADLSHLRAQYASLQHTLAETRTAAEETAARLANERALERTALEALVTSRDAELREQAVRQQQADATAAAALAELEDRVRVSAEMHRADQHAIARLEHTLTAVGRDLDAMRRERDALSARAGRVPALQRQIDGIHEQNRHMFNEMPVSMCRCGRDGAVTQANGALVRLLGYASPDDVQKLDASEAIFDSGDELQWLFDLCQTSRASQSIETTWKKRDGSHILVRVMAMPVAADLVDLVAEDITRIRVLEEKLRNSQRMEAVARYGSEVAVTCHSLLSHVKQEGQQWLASMESDTARYQGELLFDDVTRAAGFLQQFAAYGDEQKNTPELVDVSTLLRDLEPVLKRVAGDDIDFVLKPPRTPLNLDVEARRVERMLINVAAYSRERMPFGGRLAIDVASVVVNREFVARYPNVRPGDHVLLTVSEVPGRARRASPQTVGTAPAAAPASSPSDNPGVDLGTLQALVSDCGGHLWMTAERSGNMVLKIHVPRRVLDRSRPAMRPVRPRWIHRAFGARH